MPRHSPGGHAPTPPRGVWDFPNEGSARHVTSLHPYPARFIPAIPRAAIELFGHRGGVVWDPFAGCGTTLVEARAAGMRAVGIDVNPLACLLQRVFTTRLTSEQWSQVRAFLEELRTSPPLPSIYESLELRSQIPALTHWFGEGSIRALDSYLRLLETTKLSAAAEDVCKFALSRVAVRLSRQQSDTQYRAIRADLTAEGAMAALLSSLTAVVSELPRYLGDTHRPGMDIRLGDARDPETYTGLPAPDLIVTSPPYPNSFEYWLYHKYRMFWLDMDPLWARSHEIGARPFYSGTGKLGPEDFRQDIRKVLQAITTHAKPSTTQVWIVGEAVIKGTRFDTAESIADQAEQLGWVCRQKFERRIARGRSSFQGIGRLKTETVLVLRQVAA